MNITENVKIAPAAREAVTTLKRAGYDAYLVGGCVRDMLVPLMESSTSPFPLQLPQSAFGCVPSGWDIATNARTEDIRALLGGRVVAKPGPWRETVIMSTDGTNVEITTFWDGAKTIEEDLVRRDFTVNAMAFDIDGKLIDPFCGVDGMRAEMLRTVGDAEKRFQEDELRILRGLRLAAVFGWGIDLYTLDAMHAKKRLLENAAPERVGAELTKMLCGAHIEPVLREFSDVLSVPLPEIAPCVGFRQNNRHHHLDVWEHTIAVVNAIPTTPVLRLAALLHDLGKPACYSVDTEGIGHFYGHAAHSARIAEDILKRLRFSDEIRSRVVPLVKRHGDILTDTPSRRTVRRMAEDLGLETFGDLLVLRDADIAGHNPETRERTMTALRRFLELFAELELQNAYFSVKDLAVRGYDIMDLGYRGPEVGRKLRELVKAVGAEHVPNEREALMDFLRHPMPLEYATR